MVFLVGSLLGVIRTLFLVPLVGPMAAVAAEVPLMLAASWMICGEVLRRTAVLPRLGDRLLMGGVALLALWMAEFGLSAALGTSAAAFLRALATPAGILGLMAQLIFGAIPLMRRRAS